jgi:hypothetical protein
LIIGDFLGNLLSVSTAPAGLFSFLCKLFTRIRTNDQAAFLLATEDMHDSKKTAILKRFGGLIIECSSVEDVAGHRVEARMLHYVKDQYSYWENSETPNPRLNRHHIPQQWNLRFGRQSNVLLEQSIEPSH